MSDQHTIEPRIFPRRGRAGRRRLRRCRRLAQTRRNRSGRRAAGADAAEQLEEQTQQRAALDRARSGRLGARAHRRRPQRRHRRRRPERPLDRLRLASAKASAASRSSTAPRPGEPASGARSRACINCARRRRSPGPELGNPALSFRAWYETLNGTAAFDALDRIPRTRVGRLSRLVPAGHGHDGPLRHAARSRSSRKATCCACISSRTACGASRPRASSCSRTATPAPAGRTCPTSCARCRPSVWTHTTGNIPFDAMAGKVVGVVGAGSSAFDAAAVALESGAAEVHMFSRRAYIDYPARRQPARKPAAARSIAATATCSS